MSKSRTTSSILIISTGLVQNIVTLILGFATRTVFIRILGAEYLGLNGLFMNVVSLISLAELGIGSAITYYLYKPLAHNNEKQLKNIMDYYKKAYLVVGLVILIIGLSIYPFLDSMVNIEQGTNINYHLIYILFLIDAVISYAFFAYRSTIIFADQKNFILNKINIQFSIIKFIFEICILIVFKNYYLALVGKIMLTAAKNIVISQKASNLYPFITGKSSNKLSKQEKTSIMKDVYSIFIFKLASRLFESTDNIIISTIIGTVFVGLYSNYLLIITSITSVLNIIRSSFVASVGNINVLESIETKYKTFKNLDLVNFWLCSICAVCFYHLLNPFISLWLGKDYLLSQFTVGVIVANFISVAILNIVFIFRESMGLFRYGRYLQLVGGIVNIVLSIILGKAMGVSGVLLATLITGLTITIFPFPKILFKYGFEKSCGQYIIRYFSYLIFTFLSIVFVALASILINETTWVTLMVKFLLCLLVPNLFYYILFKRTEEFKWIEGKVKVIYRYYTFKRKI